MLSHHMVLLSAVLPVGTATAKYFETKWYTDSACQELSSTSMLDGVSGKNTGGQPLASTPFRFRRELLYLCPLRHVPTPRETLRSSHTFEVVFPNVESASLRLHVVEPQQVDQFVKIYPTRQL